ncbi:MAG TPA: FAD-dependent oxidoreductase [Ottowia sp.]|nr:FAD-dependent oxidoreductase [Ottowia sp.]HON29484.1 FAD-dependent oxidoreductase [Ottowia sp.]
MTPHRPHPLRRIAIIGAGIAGLACARTLRQAGHDVAVFEAEPSPGGRMATVQTAFGGFDAGVQYFTVRDERFMQALQATAPDVVRRWSANAVRVLDERGRVAEAAPPAPESHWVAVPAMDCLPRRWAEPLTAAGALHLDTRVTRIARDRLSPTRWQLHTTGHGDEHLVHAGFDHVVLAVTASQAREVLQVSEQLAVLSPTLAAVDVAPCWTLMLAYPNAAQPGLHTLGPQWNAARSTHHRVSWLARESSKPGRTAVERWTVQASAAWSREHERDDPARANAKLLRAFAEITGIHATPAHAEVRLWRQARTLVPLGRTHLWDDARGIGLCGDWCIGSRVEDAFVSGLALALAMDER